MKNWTRRHTLISGVLLILLTNAVALLGVAWNRSGEPDSVLTLTQRELSQPFDWQLNLENSGMSLRIHWRVYSGDKNGGYSYYGGYGGGSPAWLDQAKLASLGFEVSPPATGVDSYRWSSRQLSKDVLVVLEMDGPAYQQALQHARENAAEQNAKLAANPDNKAAKASATGAQAELTREEQENSRLFAVDAGLSQNELRSKYPDRNRYAIVHAQVRPWSGGEPNKITGYIDKISIDEINVPYEYRASFGRGESRASAPLRGLMQPLFNQSSGRALFEARVVFGQRLEPWLLSVHSAK